MKMFWKREAFKGKKEIVEVPVDLISPNPFQPRREFDEKKLQGLVQSVKTHGVIVPIIARKVKDKFELVAGERRLRACKQLGYETIPALVRDLTDSQMSELAFIENMQRENLNVLEESEAYARLAEEFESLSLEELSRILGQPPGKIYDRLLFSCFPAVMKKAVAKGVISEKQAFALVELPTQDMVLDAIEEIYQGDLSLTQTKEMVRKKLTEEAQDEEGEALKGEKRKHIVSLLSQDEKEQEFEELLDSMPHSASNQKRAVFVLGAALFFGWVIHGWITKPPVSKKPASVSTRKETKVQRTANKDKTTTKKDFPGAKTMQDSSAQKVKSEAQNKKESVKTKPVEVQEETKQPVAETKVITIKVSSGDTLWGLAKRYDVSVSAIKAFNGLKNDTVRIGQVLKIPRKVQSHETPKEEDVRDELR